MPDGVASVGTNTKPHRHAQSSPTSQADSGPKSLSSSFRPVSRQWFTPELPTTAGAYVQWHPDPMLGWMSRIRLGWAFDVTDAISLSSADSVRKLNHSPRTPDCLIPFESKLARHHVDFKTESSHNLRKPLQGFVVSPDRFSFHAVHSGAESFGTEGVLVAKKDYNLPKHEDLDVPNLEVIKALQSLTSKGLVKTQFSWQYYYYTVTPEGVEYLREWYARLYDQQLELFDADMYG